LALAGLARSSAVTLECQSATEFYRAIVDRIGKRFIDHVDDELTARADVARCILHQRPT
jgi:hypothetical protein